MSPREFADASANSGAPSNAPAVRPPASAPAARLLFALAFSVCICSSCLIPGPRMLYATHPSTGPNTAKNTSGRPSSAVCMSSCAASARSAKNMEAATLIAAVCTIDTNATITLESVFFPFSTSGTRIRRLPIPDANPDATTAHLTRIKPLLRFEKISPCTDRSINPTHARFHGLRIVK